MSDADARFKNGVLNVTLPGTADTQQPVDEIGSSLQCSVLDRIKNGRAQRHDIAVDLDTMHRHPSQHLPEAVTNLTVVAVFNADDKHVLRRLNVESDERPGDADQGAG